MPASVPPAMTAVASPRLIHSVLSSGVGSLSRARVDGAAERDQRAQPLAAPVGGRLVAEHPALGVADQVHILTGGLCGQVNRLAQRDDVVGQIPSHTTLDLVG